MPGLIEGILEEKPDHVEGYRKRECSANNEGETWHHGCSPITLLRDQYQAVAFENETLRKWPVNNMK